MRSQLMRGVAAGAAGTTALNAATYLDMLLRARPASTTPEDTVRRTEELTELSLSEEGPDSEAAENRRSGLGALMGIAVGLSSGAAYALVRSRLPNPSVALGASIAGLIANVGSVGPMAALGITDPRTWPAGSWVADLVPHLCYGVVTAAVFEALERPPP